jgi:hypothetical protein
MASLLRGLPGGEEETRRIRVPREMLPNFLEESRVKTLMRSLFVLDEWLEDNNGKLKDEVRLRRVKHWREEALQQLRLELNLSRA